MQKLRLFFLTVAELGRQVCLLPRIVVIAVEQRRQRFALNALEAERLDRIRNPSKYLGK
jgi:hypothetical protein